MLGHLRSQRCHVPHSRCCASITTRRARDRRAPTVRSTSRRSEMSSANYSLRYAVHCVLLASVAAMPAVPAFAQETDSAARPIEEVIITGSRIRRVDEETASPVFVMDAGTIANTGVTTLGDLMMRVPAISGAATNPQVNNGGGTGESNVELRGLGA